VERLAANPPLQSSKYSSETARRIDASAALPVITQRSHSQLFFLKICAAGPFPAAATQKSIVTGQAFRKRHAASQQCTFRMEKIQAFSSCCNAAT
jgi:hypothetical protein